MNKYEILKFKDGEFELDVNVSPDEDTVWLSLSKIAILFDKDKSTISRHIKNIYEQKELVEIATVAKNAIVQIEEGLV
ncbi:MAG: death-on-curing protein [Firmicutes bacterium]|nr:death-on-curing protein [Candidatus Fiminaster equi]